MTIHAATSCLYRSPISVPYTGTKDQPDIVSILFKNNQNQVSLVHENIHALSNYNPLNFQIAIYRITEAVNKIFLCMRGKDSDLWNATKNLTRGVVALIPLIGNGTLYLYDRIKTHFYTNPKIKNSLSSQEGPILGIAFDGKVIKTFSLDEISKALKGQPHNPLGVLNYIWLSLLQKSLKESPKMTRRDVVNELTKQIAAKSISW
jgi:hypothetical protein